ncbi:hypothetical protein ACFVH0_15270 [Streptomyces sp. NPDC127117]|uniref:hypothetical protein n=1 Tax=Streptomyces sp. NPDC127117 TaxID=3345368 RepID=UPI003626DCD5
MSRAVEDPWTAARGFRPAGAPPSRPDGVLRIGPGGVDTEKTVMRHPAPARSTESRMFAGNPACVNGRIVVTPSGVNGSGSEHEARMLSFAPAKP